MREIVKPGIVLFLMTAAVALILAAANAAAAGPAAENAREAKERALSQVLPEAAGFQAEDTKTGNVAGVISYNAASDGSGWAFTCSAKGYGGGLSVLVGINKDGAVEGITILSHNETPGLGANAAKPGFSGQFAGKSGPFAVVKTAPAEDSDVQAIASATITSRAVTGAVNSAVYFWRENMAEGGGGA